MKRRCAATATAWTSPRSTSCCSATSHGGTHDWSACRRFTWAVPVSRWRTPNARLTPVGMRAGRRYWRPHRMSPTPAASTRGGVDRSGGGMRMSCPDRRSIMQRSSPACSSGSLPDSATSSSRFARRRRPTWPITTRIWSVAIPPSVGYRSTTRWPDRSRNSTCAPPLSQGSICVRRPPRRAAVCTGMAGYYAADGAGARVRDRRATCVGTVTAAHRVSSSNTAPAIRNAVLASGTPQ